MIKGASVASVTKILSKKGSTPRITSCDHPNGLTKSSFKNGYCAVAHVQEL